MKVNGFTTLELAVAMLLTVLVTTIGYSGYLLYTRQWYHFQTTLDENEELRNFQTLLYRDLYNSRNAMYQPEGIQLNFDKSPSITYAFLNDFILRGNNNLSDTFHIPVNSYNAWIKKTQVMVPGIIINKIQLEVGFGKELVELNFFKEYSRSDFMDMELNDEYRNS